MSRREGLGGAGQGSRRGGGETDRTFPGGSGKCFLRDRTTLSAHTHRGRERKVSHWAVREMQSRGVSLCGCVDVDMGTSLVSK